MTMYYLPNSYNGFAVLSIAAVTKILFNFSKVSYFGGFFIIFKGKTNKASTNKLLGGLE